MYQKSRSGRKPNAQYAFNNMKTCMRIGIEFDPK